MASIVTYIRSLMGWTINKSPNKRHRLEDDLLSDDGLPPFKIFKHPESTNITNNMSLEDERPEVPRPSTSKVRYIPIQVECDHASTSTPHPSRRVINLVEEDYPSPRRTTPKPKLRAMLHNNEVKWIEEPEVTKSPQKYYIKIDDDDNDSDKDDVIFVERTELRPIRSSELFQRHASKSPLPVNGSPTYTRFNQSLQNRTFATTSSNKINSKFKTAGVTKQYKKETVPVPKWMQTFQSRSRNQKMAMLSGSSGSVMRGIFNLEAKQMFHEMIQDSINPNKHKNLKDTIGKHNDSGGNYKDAKKKLTINNIHSSSKISISSDSDVEVIPSESSTTSSIKVDPVNSLKDSFKEFAITREDWLPEFNTRHSQKNNQIQEKLSLAKEESDIVSKLQKENAKALMEYHLKSMLDLPVCLVQDLEPELTLPKLTQEQEMMVDKAFANGRGDDLLTEKFNLKIHRRDLATLRGLNWLNDEVINFYMNLLMQRSESNPKLPKVYATNTFFYPRLLQSGQAGLRRWTRKVDIFSHELMIVPVHLGVHWCVALVRFREARVEYLDSMGGHNPAALGALLDYLRLEHRDKKAAPLADGWTVRSLSSEVPQQMNGSDCGMFLCTFAEFAARGAPYRFSQAHMPALRRKVACEILLGKLLT